VGTQGPHSLQLWKYMTQIRDLEERQVAFFFSNARNAGNTPLSIDQNCSFSRILTVSWTHTLSTAKWNEETQTSR